MATAFICEDTTRTLERTLARGCAVCAAPFIPRNAANVFCSKPCQSKAAGIRRCDACGCDYSAIKDSDRRFCGPRCNSAWRATRSSQPVSFRLFKGKCSECGKRFDRGTGHAKCCSASCLKVRTARLAAAAYASTFVPSTFNCAHCGEPHVTAKGAQFKRYCSAACSKAAARRREVENGNRSASRRARKLKIRGVAVEHVNPIKVLERDKWTCQLCGVKTPRKLRGTFDDRAPEVDHILPLAKGGEHSYRNVQCACRKCNLMKMDTPKGQMLLFG